MTDKEKKAVNELSAYLNHIGVDPTAWGAEIETKETETAIGAEIQLTANGDKERFYGVVRALEKDTGTHNIESALKSPMVKFMGLHVYDQVNDWNGTGKPISVAIVSDCGVDAIELGFYL